LSFVPIAAIALVTTALLVSRRSVLNLGLSQMTGLSFGLCGITLAKELRFRLGQK